MDITFFEGLELALNETIENFILMLKLSEIPLYIWLFLAIFFIFIPFLGFLLYKLLNKYSISINKKTISQFSFIFFILFIFWNIHTKEIVKKDIYQIYKKSLPWKKVLFLEKQKKIKIKSFIKKNIYQKNKFNHFIPNISSINYKPNIYLFIIESLRKDLINHETAPHINSFKKENIFFENSFSNSNSTQCSWFSIFYSNYPFYWANDRTKYFSNGSLPLKILKKMGYKINVYNASQLQYYKMDELIFSKNKNLANFIFSPISHRQHEMDKTALNKMLQNIESDQGNIHIIFLDSTHFGYDWPNHSNSKFTPYLKQKFNFYANISKKKLPLLKNRYKNSILFIDSLFKKFIKFLKQKKIYDDSIIIFTSDHGEEFLDRGKLLHASHLSNAQTKIPIYYKLGKEKIDIDKKNLTSQIDIFPSILDYLISKNSKNLLFKEKQSFLKMFKGKSILSKKKKDFILSTRYNGSSAPFQFFIYDGKDKITLEFAKKNIFKIKKINIISVRDEKDKIIPINDLILEKTQQRLYKIFNK
ncbi:MAG: hypothetical protein AMS24_00740 [Chlamydiae bacterium SM23_39]|nr:MAG: hypothetical protein AMS24_00740 [Chlamydiae bacterium SM23_39]